MAYSDFEKMTALELVERAGGEITPSVLEEIRAALSKPKLNQSTVWRWVQSAQMQAPPQNANLQNLKNAAQQQIERSLDDLFEQVARLYLDRALAPDVIAAMKGRDLVIAAATAFDKMRLARDLPTEIVQLLPGVQDALATLGMSAADLFEAIIAEAAAKREYDAFDQS